MSRDTRKLLKIALTSMMVSSNSSNNQIYRGNIGGFDTPVTATSKEEATYLLTKIARASNERLLRVIA